MADPDGCFALSRDAASLAGKVLRLSAVVAPDECERFVNAAGAFLARPLAVGGRDVAATHKFIAAARGYFVICTETMDELPALPAASKASARRV